MFKVYTAEDTPSMMIDTSGSETIRVSVLNGDSINVLFSPSMTVMQLKQIIMSELGHVIQKQKLLWKENELKVIQHFETEN